MPCRQGDNLVPPLFLRTIEESGCTAAKLGAAIPNSAIGEPVGAVTLAAPVWIGATPSLPAHCSIEGAMAPVHSTAKEIRFRVLLPAGL